MSCTLVFGTPSSIILRSSIYIGHVDMLEFVAFTLGEPNIKSALFKFQHCTAMVLPDNFALH